jgi:hypothetical protein
MDVKQIEHLVDEIELVLDYYRDEFPDDKQAWADSVCPWAGGVSANDLVKVSDLLKEIIADCKARDIPLKDCE